HRPPRAPERREAPQSPRDPTRRRRERARPRTPAPHAASTEAAHGPEPRRSRRPRASPDLSYRDLREIDARTEINEGAISETKERATIEGALPPRTLDRE